MSSPVAPPKQESTGIRFIPRVVQFVIQLATLFVYSLLALIEMTARGSLAALIALVDTIIWLTIVFAVAAPMILSGLYEAAIDRIVVESLEKALRRPPDDHDGHALRHRVHLMYGVLVGNLVLKETRPETREQLETAINYGEEAERSAWDDICHMVNLIPENPSLRRDLSDAVKKSTHVRPQVHAGLPVRFRCDHRCGHRLLSRILHLLRIRQPKRARG